MPRAAKKPNAELGARMKEARIAAGLTIAQAATKARLKYSTYHSYESGERAPVAADLPRVARCLGTTVGALFGEAAS